MKTNFAQNTYKLKAGIYIHIPFCKQACHYCNFHFSTSLKNKTALLEALTKEIEIKKNTWNKFNYQSVYFGGGTPSLLNPEELKEIISLLNKNFKIQNNAEYTLEANPDDITKEYLSSIKNIGINRLSIGIQSFHKKDLQYMNRSHNDLQAINSIKLAHNAGFKNLSIDLIYGTPTMTDKKWKENIDTASKLPISHLSSYALTLEPNTALNYYVQSGKYSAPDDEKAARHFEILTDYVTKHNWDHYEISNIAIDGKHAVHNSNYWSGSPYLGLGPAAHSFDGKNIRSWNISNNAKYIKNINQDLPFSESETLSNKDRFNESIMTGLRQKEGISIDSLNYLIDINNQKTILQELERSAEKGYLILDRGKWAIVDDFRFMADQIISDLFLI